MVFVGLLMGSMSSGYLYQLTSASVVFGCSTFSAFLALICVYLFLKESNKNVTEETSPWVKKYIRSTFIMQLIQKLT